MAVYRGIAAKGTRAELKKLEKPMQDYGYKTEIKKSELFNGYELWIER